MKSIFYILKNIRNLLPYFLLIAIYFFFINLEAKKGSNIKLNVEKNILEHDNKSSYEDEKLKITIPVIPYNQ